MRRTRTQERRLCCTVAEIIEDLGSSRHLQSARRELLLFLREVVEHELRREPAATSGRRQRVRVRRAR